jgi:hypothetical protein
VEQVFDADAMALDSNGVWANLFKIILKLHGRFSWRHDTTGCWQSVDAMRGITLWKEPESGRVRNVGR